MEEFCPFTKRLIDRFPILMENAVNGSREPISVGVETSPGWDKIIESLCEKLATKPDIRITQIKPKYGGLRVHATNCDEEAYEWLQEAENESYKTCELCGEPGKTKTITGWTMTICEKCEKERWK